MRKIVRSRRPITDGSRSNERSWTVTHGRARAAAREGVEEVRDGGPEAAQQPRQRDGHPRDLAPRRQLDRLDPLGHELGPASDRREAEVGRRLCGELARGARRRTSRPRCAAGRARRRRSRPAAGSRPARLDGRPRRWPRRRASQENARARSRPSARSSSPRSIASARPARDRVGSSGSTSTAAPPVTSGARALVRGDHRRAAGHRLDQREPEPLVRARRTRRSARRGRAARAPRRRPSRASAPARRRHARRPSRASPATSSGRPFSRARSKPSTSRGRFLRGSSVPTAST